MSSYNPYKYDAALQQLSCSIAVCQANCLVTKRHPFYPTPDQPPFYYGKRPLLPVVPTYLARGKIMILGEYPNCRFATVPRPTNGALEARTPVADINEPFETGRYFNGHQIQLYPTGKSLQDYYLTPLGINLETDVWLTNVVKCFLMRAEHVRAYKALGWIGNASQPKVSSSHSSYFKVAAVCFREKLLHEMPICQPKVVIGLGEYVYRMMHSNSATLQPAPDLTPYSQITGVPLLAGVVSHPADQRNDLFKNVNVIHLYHPSRLAQDANALNEHLTQFIPPTQNFLRSLGL